MSACSAPMIIPLLLVLILGAVLFPRFTRFVLTLIFFAALLFIASFIDHASAQGLTDRQTLYRCMQIYAKINAEQIVAMQSFGSSAALPLAQMCSGATETYAFHCQQKGQSVSDCYGDVRDDAEKIISELSR